MNVRALTNRIWILAACYTILTIHVNVVHTIQTAHEHQITEEQIQLLVDQAVADSIAQKERDDLLESDENGDPEVMPGFFEGDIAGIKPSDIIDVEEKDTQARVGINFEKFPERKWTNNTIPFVISPKYKPEEYQIIMTSIRILSFFTCLQFKEWEHEPDYLIIWPVKKPSGCWSYVGKLKGPQILSLQPPNEKSRQCFSGIGRPLHEIMHALGVYHEQSRPDRDKYISLVHANVRKGFLNNFSKVNLANVSMSYDYDYNSIMHYGFNFFSKNRKKATLIPKDKGRKIGQRINLSRLDCLKLNKMYGCFDESIFNERKYTAICDFLGLESTWPSKKRKNKNK